jgi:hypothetical protein
LTGIAAGVTAHTVNVFTRNTNPRTELGNSLFDEICALFTGVFQNTNASQCNGSVATPASVTSGPFVTQVTGPITAFPGFGTSKTATINNDWWIYTAAFIGVFPFDTSLYGTYNSLFASNNGASDVPPCSTASVPTSAASDYVYNCIPLYDQLSNAMEFSACGSTVNSPAPGQVTPTFGNCAGGAVTGLCGPATNCDSVSAGYQAENLFGQHVVTIPVFSIKDQLGYLADMQNVINSVGTSIPQFYTWLNAHTSTPAASGTLLANCPATPAITGPNCFREGFAVDTTSLNPYDASTFWDFNIIGNIYDSLSRLNPAANNQLVDWMTINVQQLDNSRLGYTPALGTTTSYRFTLRGGLFWHDGATVTPWDVKFSYLTLKATGALQAVGLGPVTDVHVLNLKVFDINLRGTGPFTLFGITSPTIIPGRHWSAGGLSAWDSALTTCSGSATPDSCFTTSDPGAISVTATVVGPKFDPIANGILIGSGPYMCLNPATGMIGGGCSSTGTENPGVGGFYQLTRFGAGTTPGKAGMNNSYFRSSGILALDIWSGDNGDITHDFVNVSALAVCFGKPIGASACMHWQQGIGAPLGGFGNPIPCASTYNCAVGFLTVSFVASGFGPGFPGINPVEPYSWLPGIAYSCCSFTPSLVGGASFPLILYEGISTGNSGNPFPAGTAQVLEPASLVGCSASYPTGGYDC